MFRPILTQIYIYYYLSLSIYYLRMIKNVLIYKKIVFDGRATHITSVIL